MKLAKTSLVLLAIQLAIVSSIAAKYLYQRWTCPRVWTRSVAYEPEMLMRGRYLSMQLTVDGCQSPFTPAEQAAIQRRRNEIEAGTALPGMASSGMAQPVRFAARLKVQDGKLMAVRIPKAEGEPGFEPGIESGIESVLESGAQMVTAGPGSACSDLRLDAPVYFYIAEHAVDPTPRRLGTELWVEVTVPPKGPPRPLQLALKENGVWKPLAFQ